MCPSSLIGVLIGILKLVPRVAKGPKSSPSSVRSTTPVWLRFPWGSAFERLCMTSAEVFPEGRDLRPFRPEVLQVGVFPNR